MKCVCMCIYIYIYIYINKGKICQCLIKHAYVSVEA